MFKTRWINGKYVGQDGSVIIAVTTQKQCAQEILIIRSRDHEAQDQFVIHNIAVDTRFGSVHKTQGQSVGLHGEKNFVEKRVKEMIVFDLDENFRKLDIQIQVLEYRYKVMCHMFWKYKSIHFRYPTTEADLENPTSEDKLLFSSDYFVMEDEEGVHLNVVVKDVKTSEVTKSKYIQVDNKYRDFGITKR